MVIAAIGSLRPAAFRSFFAIVGVFFLIAAIPLFTQSRLICPPLPQSSTSFAPMSIVTNAIRLRFFLMNLIAVASCEFFDEVFLYGGLWDGSWHLPPLM